MKNWPFVKYTRINSVSLCPSVPITSHIPDSLFIDILYLSTLSDSLKSFHQSQSTAELFPFWKTADQSLSLHSATLSQFFYREPQLPSATELQPSSTTTFRQMFRQPSWPMHWLIFFSCLFPPTPCYVISWLSLASFPLLQSSPMLLASGLGCPFQWLSQSALP